MGVLGKLMFWKKKDDFSLDGQDIGKFGTDNGFGDVGKGMGEGNLGMEHPDNLGLPNTNPYLRQSQSNFQGTQIPSPNSFSGATAPPGFQAPPITPEQPPRQDYVISKDMEIISAKLDSLKAYLDAINQRLSNIERIASSEQDKKRGW